MALIGCKRGIHTYKLLMICWYTRELTQNLTLVITLINDY